MRGRGERANGKIPTTIDLLDLTLMELQNYLYARFALSDDLFSALGIIGTRRLLPLVLFEPARNFHK